MLESFPAKRGNGSDGALDDGTIRSTLSASSCIALGKPVYFSYTWDQLVDGQQTARAIDYTLKRWEALFRYTENGELPIDNNWVENQIRPWALGRNNWLFAGSVRAGQRAANIMSLVQSAKINGLEPRRYLTRVLDAMPTARRSDLPGLFPIQLK